jgi:prepilin-type N-terminal cleavage/methylation domain-containing protein
MTRRVNCEATHLNAGFTLVEMLVVLTIIALVLGLVAGSAADISNVEH